MREINRNLYPPNGYRFRESDGTLHTDDGWRHLESRVVAYRQRNGIPVGNVWSDMMAQVCAEVPGFCGENPPVIEIHGNNSLSFNQRVLSWFSALLGRKRLNEVPLTDDAEAASRAAICKNCPMQKALNASCGACIAAVDTSRRVILEGRQSQHRNLHCCDVLGEDCSTSVHLRQPASDNPALPAHCWRK